MPVTEVLARDYTFELNTGTEAVPTWVEIKGINTWSNSAQAGEADTTTFDDDGIQTHLKASRGHEFTLSGKVQENEDDGARDPGQEAAEAWAQEIGQPSRKQFRITSPGGTTKTFLATATCNFGGGGNDDASNWELAVKATSAIATA